MFENDPTILPLITTPQGNIYSVFFRDMDAIPEPRTFVYRSWMDERGIENPQTLDELTELLRAFKAENPDSTPLGGSANANDPRAYILTAMGYLTADSSGISPAVKNGEAVIPAYHENYRDFLTIMKTYYDEGLISPDFFTLDATAVNAQMAEGKNVVSSIAAPYLALPDAEEYSKWWAAYPLTSAVNDTPAYVSGNSVSVGGMVFSAKIKYPEVLVRIADYFFGNEGGIYMWDGPWTGSEDTLGMIKGYTFDEQDINYSRLDIADGQYPSGYAFLCSVIAPYGGAIFGYRGDLDDPKKGNVHVMRDMAGIPQPECTQYDTLEEAAANTVNGNDHYRVSWDAIAGTHQLPGYPSLTWFTEEESLIMNEIKTIIAPHIQSETAKFITGVRSLDEFDQYLEVLKDMDIEILLGYYVSAYEAYKANT